MNMGRVDSEEREFNMRDVVPLCNICHDYVELLGEERMNKILSDIQNKNVSKLAEFKCPYGRDWEDVSE